MRLSALAAILALGVMIGLSDEKAPAAKPAMAGPRPIYPLPGIGGGGYRGGNGPRMGNTPLDVTFSYNSEIGKVRSFDPPENFDEKGNVKKYKKAELLKLKGDDPAEKKMVGYKAEFSEIKVGDYVQVTISVNKNAPAKPANKAKGKKKDEEDDKKDDKEDKLAAKAPKDAKWVVATQVAGKVTWVDGANSDSDGKITIQLPTGGYPGNQKQTLDPERAMATLIVISRRTPEKAPGGK